jgi:predicted dehydrogenase
MLKHIVSTGWLGTVREMSASIGGPYDKGTQRTDFRKQRRLAGGGVLIDLGIHLIDLALWLSSERPCMVTYAGISTQGWEVEDDAGVALEFASTARATLSCSLTHALDNTFTIRGSTGWACAYLYRPTELTLFSEVARVCQKSGLQHMMLPNTPMYDKQIEHFCDAVLSGGEFMIRPDEVCAGIDVIERCYDQGSVGGLS